MSFNGSESEYDDDNSDKVEWDDNSSKRLYKKGFPLRAKTDGTQKNMQAVPFQPCTSDKFDTKVKYEIRLEDNIRGIQ